MLIVRRYMNKYVLSIDWTFQSPLLELLFILLKKYEDLFPIYSFDFVLMNDTAVNDAMAEIIAAPVKAN